MHGISPWLSRSSQSRESGSGATRLARSRLPHRRPALPPGLRLPLCPSVSTCTVGDGEKFQAGTFVVRAARHVPRQLGVGHTENSQQHGWWFSQCGLECGQGGLLRRGPLKKVCSTDVSPWHSRDRAQLRWRKAGAGGGNSLGVLEADAPGTSWGKEGVVGFRGRCVTPRAWAPS